MGITLSVLASGSRGNSIYLATERVRLLIDAGLSGRETQRRLATVGVNPKDLDGIIVTHEHLDHVRGLGSLARRYKLPVYLNQLTHAHLPESVGRLGEKVEFATGRSFSVGDIAIHPFAISHDAADPVGFALVNGSVKVGVCTDLGAATNLVHRHLENCSILVLEANHDVEMLKNGPYPWPVKQRIRSRFGHLSNEQSVKVVSEVVSDRLSEVILAHMSETNNSSEMVLKTFASMLPGHMRERLKITLASQHRPADPIILL
ncbi:MAG: MBL fold metallo-hydrolase [Deltaproteobacteria bacterium]|nr:MAG: MBL fold metallo-hydrolase [Deltaproteobacteria bacterium]